MSRGIYQVRAEQYLRLLHLYRRLVRSPLWRRLGRPSRRRALTATWRRILAARLGRS